MNLDKDFWNDKYLENDIGWDLKSVSPPIAAYFDQVDNKDLKILIPGGGSSHEAEYLFNQGFINVTVIDLSPEAIKSFQDRVPNFPKENTLVGNFFELEDQFDIIVEQTFFCALNKGLRPAYVEATAKLLAPQGKLIGLMFRVPLNENHPPFGGNISEYQKLFSLLYSIVTMEPCYNSHPSRAGSEIWVKVIKL
jgi:SAM-dependent methyltransferase